ncbi:unnamed protein product [Tetraodon nigroviridis]|uniref:(spotted green pufferfish) hypothetical protein n=1 Tax=Tetraodon nigroviridis TaxID=99883 RepID=Q4SGJ1_TETNG|nr:unnamed protein product [Tetraodon nigroviridis]
MRFDPHVIIIMSSAFFQPQLCLQLPFRHR